ncbi:response regulator transcription factor [Caldovatus aquaticus]|uniref:Response regulator n=1 Tax=Caldovatus aquaticus TaxID=2865671 RepID=A0ABS7F3L7_9PROT|nr:response regulator [Caldovatus aquaticus]MBW8269395.1 response regulator [Caldovatus aquaticus]
MTSQARRVIAVVDDDPGVRASLRFLLETAGHVVETYDSGVRFLAEADPARIACLVLDQQMPSLAGLDLLARLRAAGVTTPALLIVSTPAAAVARRAAQLGVRQVLEKPLAQDDLLARIAAATAA